jgi:hypothetical protein
MIYNTVCCPYFQDLQNHQCCKHLAATQFPLPNISSNIKYRHFSQKRGTDACPAVNYTEYNFRVIVNGMRISFRGTCRALSDI